MVDKDRVFLSVVTLAEIGHGIERSPAGAWQRRLGFCLRDELPLRFEVACYPSMKLYARCFSDSKREASGEDQLRLCRQHAERQSWTVVESGCDRAISRASLIRLRIQARMQEGVPGAARRCLDGCDDRGHVDRGTGSSTALCRPARVEPAPMWLRGLAQV